MTALYRRRVLQGLIAAPFINSLSARAAQDARADMAVLRQAMEIHPGALRYLNPVALDAALTRCEAQLTAATTLAQRYLVLSEFLSKLRCGHSYANFYNQSPDVQKALFTGTTRLPFAFRWLGDEMIVTDAADQGGLPPGTRITAIDGRDPGDMLAELLKYTRADGAAPGKRRALLEVQHRSSVEFFDVFQGLRFGVAEDGLFRIEGQAPSGNPVAIEVGAIDLAARQSRRRELVGDRGRADPIWQWRVQDGVGILTMDNWAMYQTDWDWQPWLEARLDECSSLRGLVVDLRANEGGNPIVGAMLLTRLISETVPIPVMRRLVRFRSLPESLRAHARTWDDSFYNIGRDATPVGRGFYALPPGDFPTQLEPRGKTVEIPVAVLISPTNSSATFTFARVAQSTGRVTLVGETTGGNRRGINGDGYFFTTLPHSGVEFDIPIVGTFPAVPQPDQGIHPDIEITETRFDIAQGRDATLERALALF